MNEDTRTPVEYSSNHSFTSTSSNSNMVPSIETNSLSNMSSNPTPISPKTNEKNDKNVENTEKKKEKKRKRRRFLPEEDQKIREGVDKFKEENKGIGLDWNKITEMTGISRTKEQIRARYRLLLQKEQEHKSQLHSDEEPAPKRQKTQHVQNKIDKYRKMQHASTQTEDESADYVKSLEAQISEMKTQLKELETQVKQLKEREKELTETLSTKEAKFKEQENKYRNALIQNMKEKADQERKLSRIICRENCIRIGTIVYQRKGLDVFELFQDGELLLECDEKLNKLHEEKERLEKQKKQIQKVKKNLEGDEAKFYAEQEESIKIRLANIKKEESIYIDKKSKLLAEKNAHIKEMRRIQDEDKSKFNDYPIVNDRYLMMTLLGKGGFSEVYKAFDLQECKIVACKIHQLNANWKDSRKQEYIKHVLRECKIHQALDHPRVVKMHDMFLYDDDTFITVLEYCGKMDLDSYLKKHEKLPEREAKNIISQVFSGLKYLNEQKQKIIHYDLKPANILFTDEGIKLTDFGLSKIMEEESNSIDLTSQGAGTYWYLPPECFITGTTPKISSKVDIWSAGVIFYQMLYGKKPFGDELTQQALLTHGVMQNAKNVVFPPKPQISDEAKVIMCEV